MVDLFASEYDIVIRYQGGNNAGHTVINNRGKFILNLLPSGILSEKTVNVMGNGMVIDIQHLTEEIIRLTDKGINITPENLKISDKAPVYSDKYMKKAIRMGDLLNPEELKKKLAPIVEWKNLTVRDGYKHEALSADEMYDWLMTYGEHLTPHICDTTVYLNRMNAEGKKIMFEAQLGALRDIDFGIYPYTSSSSTIAAYAPIGAGVPNLKLDETVGIIKAYSSCVGEGPFTCELFGEEGDKLREAGGEYGAATGRPRRVGGFDVVASRYGTLVQGATVLALTKLDILSGYEKIPVCTAYEVDGEIVHDFPIGVKLAKAKPVYEFVDGWNCDISKCRKKEELPEKALKYIQYIEKQMNCPIQYVSVGAEREAYIKMF